MAAVSDTERSEWQGFAVTGQALRCQAEWGIAAAARSDGVTVDPVAAAIDATDGMQTLGVTTISGLELTGIGGRGSAGDGVLRVDLGRPDPGERRLVLVEEQGRYTWVVPEAGAGSAELPLEATAGGRGLFSPMRRILRIVAVKTVGRVVRHASNTLVGGWDERRHPYRLRTWTPDDHRDADAATPDLDALLAGPALLVVHGFTGSIHGSFTFESDVVGGIHRSYGGRALAFDHPTLAVSPRDNAAWLGEQLREGMTLDVLAHSRGGLVARELARMAKDLKVTVRSITFVATPNDGTPLGDPERPMGLVDAVTNLVGALPGSEGLEMVMELLQDVVLKSALDGLVGLVAMQPGGAYLQELNADPLPGVQELRSISADFEPVLGAGIVKTAQNRLMDAYFGGVRNDRIVPTLSTVVTSGVFGVGAGRRLVLDSSRAVDHSTFWTNARAVQQLRDWLRADWVENPPAPVPEAETEPQAEVALPPDPLTIAKLAVAISELPEAARKAVEQLVGGPVNPKATPPTGSRPAVVVIPGIMGTHLRRRATGQLVWVDPLRLARGHFADLLLPAARPDAEMEPAGLNRTYVPLIAQLAAEERDVYLAPFDWRADICESATALAEQVRELLAVDPRRPVNLVAHSMGGLVARALRLVAPDVWEEMGDARRGDSGRLVMLGTPNGGSYAVPLILTGAEAILKALAVVDLRGEKDQLLAVAATFPGIYQMLPDAEPADDHHAELFKVATWGARSPVAQPLLSEAQRFHDRLRDVVEPDRMVFVAGYGHPTPFRLEVDAPGQFRIGRFSDGDGRVALRMGRLDGVETYFSGATHGGLPSDPGVLACIGELVDRGVTARLENAPPVRRGDPLPAPVMIAAEDFDLVPGGSVARGSAAAGGDWRGAEVRLSDALRITLGGGAPSPSRTTVEVKVLNASLEQARYVVAVGHHARLPQGGAELFLDRKLGGVLFTRQRLGQYPEQAGTAIFVAAPTGHRPRGAIVLGLGAMGTLTPQNLADAMAKGVMAYVLDVREHRRRGQALPPLGVSAVLVGTPGRRGLSIEQCVGALVEGMARGVAQLNETTPAARIERIGLQFVELYDQPAEEAALAVANLPEILAPEVLDQVELLTDPRVAEGDGRLAGSPRRGQSGTSWVQVSAKLAPAATWGPASLRRMTFAALARGAQANVIEHDLDLAQIQAYVAEAVAHTGGTGVSRTLYELLFPQRAKLDLDRTEGLHLIVDEELTEIPWELLAAGAFTAGVTPLALRAGMLRQLQSRAQTRERFERPSGRAVLVVGDPPTGTLPRLPGAREEATRVADLFAGQGWDVVSRIYPPDEKPGRQWIQILDALNDKPYRVVHIAAHGVFDDGEDQAQRSGVVLGPERHQRITALNFKQMTVSPDLVFLNCCHLGRLGSFLEQASSETRKAYEQPHRVAASVARQLLQNGVGAVVVAGWAVDDVAANAFASRLYERMLAGHPFGDAVFAARLEAREADFGRTTTWGAYQCYGDPDFELGTEDKRGAGRSSPVSASQLARDFDEQAARAGGAFSTQERKWISDRVDRLRDEGGSLLSDGRVLEALARALSELGRYEEAVIAYRQALCDPKGRAHLWAAEQLANLQVRLAVRGARNGLPAADVKALFKQAESELERLNELGNESAERSALQGSLLKKRATTRRAAGARQADLALARDAYARADRLGADGYHVNLWLQMCVLASGNGGLDEEAKARLEQHFLDVVKREEEDPSSDYWEVAGVADTLVTYAVAILAPPGIDDPLGQARARYAAAFRLRSTVRQRDSALEHLEDLRRLVPDGEAQRYADLLEELRKVDEAAG